MKHIDTMKNRFWTLAAVLLLCGSASAQRVRDEHWKMIWHDEFSENGAPNPEYWQSEHGFERNEEDQWYQLENAIVRDGILTLEGRQDSIPNPRYNPNRKDWVSARPYARYSSGSINTRGKFQFQYGQMEVRARIPAVEGSWPAIWTLGVTQPWPSNGECDIMEYYHIKGKPHILANAAWGNDKRYSAVWNTKTIPYEHFLEKDLGWGEKFHIWLMDWTEDYIRIYLDGELLNDIDLSKTINGKVGGGSNPFRQPHYILLDLAIGGINGGRIQDDAFPMRYDIDYVRVYQPE